MTDKKAMHPQVQYLVLQVRYLRHISAPNGAPSLIQFIMQYHLSNISRNYRFRFLSFFVPAYWRCDLIYPLSIMQPIYKAFDHFGFSPDFSSLSLANLLLLPLANLFLSIPDFCHLRVLASNFFIIDDATDRLRLRVRSKYPVKSSLCQRLYKDMLQHRTIQLQLFLWGVILQDVPHITEDQTADILVLPFQQEPLRRQFSIQFRRLSDHFLLCQDSSFMCLAPRCSGKRICYYKRG